MRLKVFGMNVPVKRTGHITKMDDLDGFYCSKQKEILIDKKLKGEEFYHTLIHEAGHALFDQISLTQAIPSELEEVIVDCFAKMMVENFSIHPKK